MDIAAKIINSFSRCLKYCSLRKNGRLVCDACPYFCDSCNSRVTSTGRGVRTWPIAPPPLDPVVFRTALRDELDRKVHAMGQILTQKSPLSSLLHSIQSTVNGTAVHPTVHLSSLKHSAVPEKVIVHYLPVKYIVNYKTIQVVIAVGI